MTTDFGKEGREIWGILERRKTTLWNWKLVPDLHFKLMWPKTSKKEKLLNVPDKTNKTGVNYVNERKRKLNQSPFVLGSVKQISIWNQSKCWYVFVHFLWKSIYFFLEKCFGKMKNWGDMFNFKKDICIVLPGSEVGHKCI